MNEPQVEEQTIEVPGRALSPGDQFYRELGYREPVDSISRIEDTARILIGVVTACAGVFLTTVKVINSVPATKDVDIGNSWFVLVFWGIGLLCLLDVVTPLPWKTRVDNPADLKATYRKIRRRKAVCLWIGMVMFLLGMVTGLMAVTGSGS